MAWERHKDKLRCQAGGIYIVHPSLISRKKKVVKNSLFQNKQNPLLAVPPCCFDTTVAKHCIHHPWWTVLICHLGWQMDLGISRVRLCLLTTCEGWYFHELGFGEKLLPDVVWCSLSVEQATETHLPTVLKSHLK